MAGLQSTITSRTLVSTSNRCVVGVFADGVSADQTTGYRTIRLGVTASAFGDLSGASGITAGTAKLTSVYASIGGISGVTAHWLICAGATFSVLDLTATNRILTVRGVGNDDFSKNQYFDQYPTWDGNITVVLDNRETNNVSQSYTANGSLFLEFMA